MDAVAEEEPTCGPDRLWPESLLMMSYISRYSRGNPFRAAREVELARARLDSKISTINAPPMQRKGDRFHRLQGEILSRLAVYTRDAWNAALLSPRALDYVHVHLDDDEEEKAEKEGQLTGAFTLLNRKRKSKKLLEASRIALKNLREWEFAMVPEEDRSNRPLAQIAALPDSPQVLSGGEGGGDADFAASEATAYCSGPNGGSPVTAKAASAAWKWDKSPFDHVTQAKCEEIDAADFGSEEEFHLRWHAASLTPVVVRNAARRWNWPGTSASSSASEEKWLTSLDVVWSDEELTRASSGDDAFVNVSFAAGPDGRVNIYDGISKWESKASILKEHQFRKHGNVVLIRPHEELLPFSGALKFLRSGSALDDVGGAPYIKQVEMDINLPSLLEKAPPPPEGTMLDGQPLVEVNLWLSAGGTTVSLHHDTTDNIMVMASGSKEFLMFPPEEEENLYFRSVVELRTMKLRKKNKRESEEDGPSMNDDNTVVAGLRVDSNHGLVDTTAPITADLEAQFPKYKKARKKALRCRVSQGSVSQIFNSHFFFFPLLLYGCTYFSLCTLQKTLTNS